MTQLLDEAAEALERSLFFQDLAARYAELRRDTDMWASIESERQAESGTLTDRSG
jgi:hypothetical protein